ncbi:MAG: polyprenyl diphosphate synthase [Candidatus Gracilibacteria bacterium]|nr:polyprenyl diphosphate synthase [Candidatus Gracilibacteria bacterium]
MHLGIIMDGNRRWAKLKSLPTIFGHKAGFDNAMKIIELVSDKNIKYITLWALSKENLVKRDSEELSGIIKLINELEKLIPKLQKNNIRFETIGDIEKLPIGSQNILKKVKAETSQNTKTFLTVALVYSGQDEIIRAVKKLINSGFDINNLDEKTFRQFIDTSNLPPADLIIRTGGDIRHSGFMLYDSDYSEYYFSKKLWPDFDEKELDNALDFFENCKRNFGK